MPSGVTATVSEWRKPADSLVVEARLDREHHARLDERVVADVQERRLVVAKPDRMAGVLAPVRHQIRCSSKYASTARSTSAQVTPGRSAVERDLLGGDGVVEQPAHLVASARRSPSRARARRCTPIPARPSR